MIVWKVWNIYSSSNRFLGSEASAKTKRVLVTILESGAIYSASLIVLLVTYVTNNEGNLPVSNCVRTLLQILQSRRVANTIRIDDSNNREMNVC